MNVFATHQSPVESAQALDDRRLVKMVLETGQIICTALHAGGKKEEVPYRPTHVKHPVCLWAATSAVNLRWLARHLRALGKEYTLRFGRKHKTVTSMQAVVQAIMSDTAAQNGRSPKFVNCARNSSLGLDFTTEPDVHMAYRKYLIEKWKHEKGKARWTNRAPPAWAKKRLRRRPAFSAEERR